jgi:hypothetical protein
VFSHLELSTTLTENMFYLSMEFMIKKMLKIREECKTPT